jgi:hypothetical protein
LHHLDPVGRFVPSSLDVSRAAAERHAIKAAVRERGRTRCRYLDPIRRPRDRFRALVAGLAWRRLPPERGG